MKLVKIVCCILPFSAYIYGLHLGDESRNIDFFSEDRFEVVCILAIPVFLVFETFLIALLFFAKSYMLTIIVSSFFIVFGALLGLIVSWMTYF